MFPPKGSKDVQGNELQMGTNCLGSYLFAKLLAEILQKTAKDAPKYSVRVTWASSITASASAPPNGVTISGDGEVVQFLNNTTTEYSASKAGNNLLASEYAKHYGADGIISVAFNPGNLKTDLARHMSKVQTALLNLALHEPIYGAYTELFSGWSPDITAEHNGSYIAPWGRFAKAREDVETGRKAKEEGGSGTAVAFWEWCDKVTKEFQ
jgi:retinol dehydrogenase 12